MSALNVMLGSIKGRASLTPSEADEAMSKHRSAICFAMEHLPAGQYRAGIGNGLCRGVIARAYYSQDRDRLADFCNMLTSGIIPNAKHRCIGLLRQWLQTFAVNGDYRYKERYGKIERTLAACLKGETLTKLYASTQELFPLPEEVSS